jgi:hypothetical protein
MNCEIENILIKRKDLREKKSVNKKGLMNLIGITITMSGIERIIDNLVGFMFIELNFKDFLNGLSKALKIIINESLFVKIVFS